MHSQLLPPHWATAALHYSLSPGLLVLALANFCVLSMESLDVSLYTS